MTFLTKSMHYNIFDFIPLANSDYTEISDLLLTIGPNSTQAFVPVDIANDTVFEITETFYVSLTLVDSAPVHVAVVPSVAVYVIDDDGME